MKALVLRKKPQSWGTPGRLTTEAGFACDTLELPWADNKRGTSCILPAPGGIAEMYRAWIWQSPSMGRAVVRLEDKHGRRDCLVHNGNFAGDQRIDENSDNVPDLFTQVHGCTEVGMGYGMIIRPDNGLRQMGVLSSKSTLAALIAHLGPCDHEFTYAWEEGVV